MSAPILLDPTNESRPAQREQLTRPASVKGLTVGLLDIVKARGDVYLNRLEELFCRSQQSILRGFQR